MAGPEAEREIIGRRAGGEAGDQGQRHPISNDLDDSDHWPERSARMRRFARQLVKRHRAAILDFAEQLVAAHELDELLARENDAA
jgi:hypothetical protein